jgi:hypothetical protein
MALRAAKIETTSNIKGIETENRAGAAIRPLLNSSALSFRIVVFVVRKVVKVCFPACLPRSFS